MSSYIKHVIENFSKETIILEIGAGHRSTKQFSDHFDKIYSIEHNERFIGHYSSSYIHVKLDDQTKWYDIDTFREKLPKDYDLLILDGPPGGYRPNDRSVVGKKFRYGFCDSFPDIKKDITIIVDDTHRPWKELEVVEFLKDNGYKTETKEGFTICIPKKDNK